MNLVLCYSPLSPFCRKVRMAMEFKGLPFSLVDTDRLEDLPAWNPRAEVPILIHGETVVCNSADILAYLDRLSPQAALYPSDAAKFADVRTWERIADTQLDAIVTTIGNWHFADLPPMPDGLMQAAKRDLNTLYDRLQERLSDHEYLCGNISAADFAAYPHVASGAALGLKFDAQRHPDIQRWLKVMRSRPEGASDAQAAKDWWANKDSKSVDTERINWGTFRLEWLLANGHTDWFAEQVRLAKVLWSCGPNSNALNSPIAPDWAIAARNQSR
ncbi:MAG: glutathione S-transferase family protein [Burkholderiaceae bacterium]|nr:glutathione S-transferase family protein [Burkholderiaceae bacterium]